MEELKLLIKDLSCHVHKIVSYSFDKIRKGKQTKISFFLSESIAKKPLLGETYFLLVHQLYFILDRLSYIDHPSNASIEPKVMTFDHDFC